MDLVVVHDIRDAQGWKTALGQEHHFPSGFDLRSFVESTDGTRAFCLWQAPDQDGLQRALDEAFGHAVVNEVIPVRVNDVG